MIALVMMLLAGLVAGGKVIDDIVGQPSACPVDLDQDAFD